MLKVNNKTAVITGGASGIGLALANRFAAMGAQVAICDINDDALARAKRELSGAGARCYTERVDISDREAVLRFADNVFCRFETVDFLFNNAGVGGEWGEMTKTPQTHWNWCLNINVLGVVHGIEAFVGRMVASGNPGHVVNTASISGLLPMPNAGAYSPSKFAVVSLTDSLALELENTQVSVSVVCPGFVNTPFLDSGRKLKSAPPVKQGQDLLERRRKVKALMADSLGVETVVDAILAGIEHKSPYILTHPEYKEAFRKRCEKILAAFDKAAELRAGQPPAE